MRVRLSAGILLLALITSGPAFAQSASAPPVQNSPAGGSGDRDEETIVVTATLRETTLQDTPVAVSVVAGETIRLAQIRDLIDLQSLVPSLRVSQNQSSAATNFIIRGFGNGANNPGIEPSVGVFVDGVYRSRSAAQISDLPNIQRIEVLRGPQSTLFGKNASVGVISVITQAPQFQFRGSASLTYGNYNTVIVRGDVTGPISDSLAFSLSGNYQRRDGFYNVVNLAQRINDRDRFDLRGQLLFRSGDLTVRVIGDYSEINELCCQSVNVLAGPTVPILNAIVPGGAALVPNSPFAGTIRLNRVPENHIRNYGGSAQADYSFGALNLTSITAYREVRNRSLDDGDFTQADLIGSGDLDAKIRTFTQELRLTSNFEGPLNFLIGGFYFNENIDFTNQLRLGTDARRYLNVLGQGGLSAVEGILGRPVGTTFFQPGQGIRDDFTLDNQAYSLFGTVDYKATDRLTFTVGLNYTHDAKQATSNVTTSEPFSAVDLVAVGVALGVPRAVANTAANPLIGLQALQFLPPFLNFPNAIESGRTRDGDLSYILRAAYRLNDHLNFYASYATGFKASSFNLSRDSRPSPADFIPGSPASLPVPAASPIRTAGLALPNLTTGSRFAGPEDSKVYEIGLRGSFRRATINLTAFRQEIDGFQSNTFTGRGFVLANAGSQTTRGIEFEGTLTPFEPLTLFLNATYLDAKYDTFVASPVGDLSGRDVAGVSPFTMSMGAVFTHDLSDGVRLTVRGDYRYESRTQVVDGLPGFVTTVGGVPSFTNALAVGRQFTREVNEFNAAASLRLRNWLEVSIYVRNLTNDRYLTTIFDGVAQNGSVFGYHNQPRTYGATVGYRF
jgi:iron complex outermembrane receptor protein